MLKLHLEIGKGKNKTPSGKIVMNGETIHDGPYINDTCELAPIIGHNVLEVSLDNKTDRDTRLDGNKIVEDVFVVIKDIKCSVTNDSAGHLDTIGRYQTDKGENLLTYGYLSYNGTYTFKFDYPFFVFARNKAFYQ